MKGGPKGRQELRIGVSQITSTPFLPEILPFILHPQALIRILPVDWPYTIPFGILYPWDPSQQILLFLEAVKQVLLV